jgi:DNA invertase Pin-like site-specific DNA recombinase
MTSNPTKPQMTTGEGQKKAIIVARTRSVPQNAERDRISLAMQTQCCEQIAASLGAEIVREFTIIGGTTEPVVRAVIEEAVQAAEAEDVTYLIVTAVDRLTRRMDELARLSERLSATGAQVVTGRDQAR